MVPASVVFFILFNICAVSAVERLPAADKAKYKKYLEIFETSRNHYRPNSMENLKNATILMKEKFEGAGLEVKLHNFTTRDTTTGQSVSGTNVIGILKGQNFNTAKDEFIILGAHLDTRGLQNVGVDNDGSGLTALISLAEDLAGKDKCIQNYTILFVAFDRSETFDVQQGHGVCNKSCGSRAFINDLSVLIGSGSVKVAIIMDCISNFNNEDNSQKIYEQPIKDYFSHFYTVVQGLIYSNKGSYVAAVGREDEKLIVDKFVELFDDVKKSTYDQYRAVDFTWNFMGKPTGINLTNVETAFEKSDTLSFWDANLKSILLTDTCFQRNVLFSCKSLVWCDSYFKAAQDNSLGFMYTTVTAVKNLTKFLACTETDVNECKQGSAQCAEKASCINTYGSYRCNCKAGFTGDGFTCDDIDECTSQGLASCSRNAECINTPGSYSCNCKKGFTGDGYTCFGSDVSSTSTVTAPLCHIIMLLVVGLLEFMM